LQHADSWVYRVYAPHLGQSLKVAGRDLLVWSELNQSELPTEYDAAQQRADIWFEEPVAHDNSEIRGGYRLPGAAVDWFYFRKAAVVAASYQLCLPAGTGDRHATLHYWVPETALLDADYVLRALPEVIGPVEFHRVPHQ
jgi:hypothetical protein